MAAPHLVSSDEITGATLFSGIGAPETAMPHWRWPWHAEIEKFPSAVLACRHPESVNIGDVTGHEFTERAAAIAKPSVLVFGSPCQSFSVAGKRLGLDDPRGNLALVALGIVARLEPRWFVFENVPGLLSSSEGRDFGLFLRAVDELGYSLAWAVLDAQHFGVAQRRQRVFAVGHLGDWRGPAAVLFEPEGLCGNYSPRREAGEVAALAIDASAHRRRGSGMNQNQMVGFNNTGQGWWNEAETAQAVRKGDDGGGGGARETLIAFGGNNTRGPIEIATAVNAHGGPSGRLDFESETFVTHALRADGFDAGEDGTGRGTPIIPIDMRQASRGEKLTNSRAHGSGGAPGHGIGNAGDPAFTVSERGQAIAFDASQDPCTSDDLSHPLRNQHNGLSNGLMAGTAVRRLTPRECERLQGYPDDYTAITFRGKPTTDGPRYKALGNSMAVPVMRWILTRIEALEASHG